jgi:methionyl aminopeptidase
MVSLKTLSDIDNMAAVCLLAGETLEYLEAQARPGVSTLELDRLAEAYILSNDAVPSPKGYRGYPNSICTAVNDVVVHGIPNETPLSAGDLITIDVTVYRNGYHGDKAASHIVDGIGTSSAHRLMETTEEAMYRGIGEIRPNAQLGDIGAAIQELVEDAGYSIVRDFCGHGIGREFHEQPQVLHFGTRGTGLTLLPGMVFTVEPMINEGSHDVLLMSDGWTVTTQDGKLSAQFEHTIAVTDSGVRILTLHTQREHDLWQRERERRGL